ncbi:RNA-directed DNA polymerase, eukaryota, reverse transcriptase zinc-binding domain protein [Tanacetum coccineum]
MGYSFLMRLLLGVKENEKAYVFKVDFQKAYDSVRWDFLDEVLKNFGFDRRCRNWGAQVRRSSFSILVHFGDGEPTYYDSAGHGQRHTSRFLTKPEALWVRVVKAIHGLHGVNRGRIYALENQKMIFVAEKMSQPGWNSSFRRMHRGGIESSQWEDLVGILGSATLSSAEDMWRRTKLGSSESTVVSARSFIDDYILPNTNIPTRWSHMVPIKVNVLAWRLAINKIATRVNLYNRGIEVNSMLCGVCDKGIESTDHFFFCCELARELMIEVGNWWSLDIPSIDSFLNWQVWFDSLNMSKNLTDSHLEGKLSRRDSNLRPLACGNNLPKDTLGGQLS